jgi:hypothetical protein
MDRQFFSNKEIMLILLSRDGTLLEVVENIHLATDLDIIETAVKQNFRALEFVDQSVFKNIKLLKLLRYHQKKIWPINIESQNEYKLA